jgi:hypothetical protein
MKRALLWLYRRVLLIGARHDLWLWDQTIAEEQARHEHFEERIRRMRIARAHVQGKIDRLSGRQKIDYSHGPTMRQRP